MNLRALMNECTFIPVEMDEEKCTQTERTAGFFID